MNIVMIPFHDCKKWIKEGYRTRDAHLAEHFCMDDRVEKVLVINRPVSLAQRIVKLENWKTPVKKVLSVKKNYRLGQLNEKLYCLDIFLPDFFKVAREKKNWWFSAFENKFVHECINNAIRELELDHAVLLLQNPMATGAVHAVSYDCFAFDAIDNWLYHPQMSSNREIVAGNYAFVEKNADVIFTVSEALKDTFKSNPNVHWIANGVDTHFFSGAFHQYSSGSKPVIGYVGKIQDRVDFDLVEICLRQFTDCRFVFLGPVYSQKNRISLLKKKYENIEFPGDVHYRELPERMKSFDIAIIPHTVDSFTDSMNPLKLYEYLAAGKPIVTTRVAGVENISQYVSVADSEEQFVKMLGDRISLLKRGVFQAEQIAETISHEYTWQNRCNEMLICLNDELTKKEK